jgi:redox-sensitive bicupin YhaK (pirin superfamily)
MHFHRPAGERGMFDHGWLKTAHTFSFGEYHDPRFMGFRALRVINEDVVAPDEGFPMHPHKNMEILTYIIEGALEHRDSMGSGSVIRPGDMQYMSAASGVFHSEFNPSKENPVHLLQIWILPDQNGGDSLYAEHHFPTEERLNRLCPVASPDGRDGSLKVRQNTILYASILKKGMQVEHVADANRFYWLQLAKGSLEVNGLILEAGDGLALWEESQLKILGKGDSEFILFDLP